MSELIKEFNNKMLQHNELRVSFACSYINYLRNTKKISFLDAIKKACKEYEFEVQELLDIVAKDEK